MKKIRKNHVSKVALLAGTAAFAAFVPMANAENSVDSLLEKLEQKGVLTTDEANQLKAENAADQTNAMSQLPASKWKMSDSIKSMQFFGDVRVRYEYRGVDNTLGASPNTYYRERFRYALRFGIRGDLYDDFDYGVRLETSTNPRSPWDTFGSNTTGGSVSPSDKNGSGIGVGQIFLGYHPASWFEMTVGRMPQPLYTTPMMWDSDINPEGAFEKIKYSIGDADLFADFGQFDYQGPTSTDQLPSGDTFILAWQLGANYKFSKQTSFKIAPVLYSYTGVGTGSGLNQTFVGQGNSTNVNVGVPNGTAANIAAYNQEGINNLLILEIPWEFNFPIPKSPFGPLHGRLFGDFAYNFHGDDRATAAYNANPAAFPGVSGPVTGENKAYQVGFGVGSAGPVYGPTQGLVYGSTSKKNTWEARVYWQHIEQYALDVNLIDSDFFEGRGNLQGLYASFAYSFTDAIIGTLRYGYANQINSRLGTGGNNLDIPGINPIKNYNLVQMDLTWRF